MHLFQGNHTYFNATAPFGASGVCFFLLVLIFIIFYYAGKLIFIYLGVPVYHNPNCSYFNLTACISNFLYIIVHLSTPPFPSGT